LALQRKEKKTEVKKAIFKNILPCVEIITNLEEYDSGTIPDDSKNIWAF